MANSFGYNQQFAVHPGMWDVDGYAICVDGNGTLQIQSAVVLTTGVLGVQKGPINSGQINDITESANSSGIYKIHLKESWIQLLAAEIETVLPSGSSPAVLMVQHLSDTVGNVSFGPGLSELQFVQFTTVVPSTGSAGVIPQGGGLRFRLRLKTSSA